LGRLEVGWEKMECWSTKAAICLKRVKTEENYYGGPTEITNALSNIPFPTPNGLLYPNVVGSQPPPITSIAIISGTDKATDFKFGHTFTGSIRKKPLKF